MKTQSGYEFDEVVSALQKEIRRGREVEAMYWALELIPQFEDALWRRLIAIVNEDIGLANPMLLVLIPQQRALYIETRELGKDGTARLILANAILAMCRSEKSRLADHFQCYVAQSRLQGKMKIAMPDYALDKHTRRGHNLGRKFDQWLNEGCWLANPSPTVFDPYAEDARQLWLSDKFQKIAWPKRKKAAAATAQEDPQMGLFDQ